MSAQIHRLRPWPAKFWSVRSAWTALGPIRCGARGPTPDRKTAGRLIVLVAEDDSHPSATALPPPRSSSHAWTVGAVMAAIRRRGTVDEVWSRMKRHRAD